MSCVSGQGELQAQEGILAGGGPTRQTDGKAQPNPAQGSMSKASMHGLVRGYCN